MDVNDLSLYPSCHFLMSTLLELQTYFFYRQTEQQTGNLSSGVINALNLLRSTHNYNLLTDHDNEVASRKYEGTDEHVLTQNYVEFVKFLGKHFTPTFSNLNQSFYFLLAGL